MGLTPTGGSGGGSAAATPGVNGYFVPLQHPSSKVGTWGFTGGTAGPWGGGWWVNSTAAQNDSLTWPVYVNAGTYVIDLLFAKSSNGGIITVTLAGVSAGTADTFNGTTVNNVAVSMTGIVIPSSGLTTLVCTAATKNASSSAFALNFHYISIRRSA